ncbi:hypothetical protein [uncultured Draconibacterium sp.]|uniref:hypothetical protein n=1 Tax=uncultured Draconibacterium sp. TaxID=1573823 RepID=UPI002AA6140C|nr:hypothetical protein [uncultured Draconibacterium sp.]
MKKYIFLPLLFVSALCWGQAQFVVQNGNKTEVYTNINTAIENAVDGDTLYIPGGGFSLSSGNIYKSLHWVGVGHYPSETGATHASRITTAINLYDGCSGSSFEGIYFTGNFQIGIDADVTNITIKRCRIGGSITFRYNNNPTTPNLKTTVIECVINGSLTAKGAEGCSIQNSILFGTISYFKQSEFKHNAINANGSSSQVILNCESCLFINNAFGYENATNVYCTDCTLTNNVLAEAFPTNGSVTDGGGNFVSVGYGLSDVYTDLSGSNSVTTFSYDNDYSLKDPTWISSDGTTPIGIYGTATPYKTIPYYPHINAATVTDEVTNNQLGVDIEVQAQER